MTGLFDEIGIFSGMAMPIVDKDKSKKKETPVKNEKQKNAKAEIYKAPMKILFDGLETIDINEKTEITKKNIMEEIDKHIGCKLFSSHETDFTINKIKENVYLVRPSISTKYEKGCGGKRILINSLANIEDILEQSMDEEIPVEKVIDYVKNSCGIDTHMHLIDDVYIPVPYLKSKDDISSLEFPARVSALGFGGEILEINENDYKAIIPEKEGQISLIDDGKTEVSKEMMDIFLRSMLPDYSNDLEFAYVKESNMIQIMHKPISGNISTGSTSSQTEQTYPSDAVISLIFTKIPLDKSMFNGKEKISKKDILKVISVQYPEYSAERTEITYDEKKKLIIPVLKSGKRGSYSLTDQKEYRRENSEIMDIVALKEDSDRNGCVTGEVQFKLPKIPKEILNKIIIYFQAVYETQQTEAIVQIYYQKCTKEYEFYIPKQKASSFHVDFERNPEWELNEDKLLVMEIHSHGSLSPHWSMTDNEDEIAHRLYGVVGYIDDFVYDERHIRVRAATGGLHVMTDINDIFGL